jgi:hypothetical protein
MNQKQEVIELIHQTDSLEVLKQIKAILVKKTVSQTNLESLVPEHVWQEVEQAKLERENKE